MTIATRPLPHPSAWSKGYWDAARERRFVVQECQECQKLNMYPKRFCPHCLSERLTWKPSKGRGTIYSVTTQLAGPPTGLADMLPYVIAIIQLDEGVQLMSNIVGKNRLEAKIGDPVEVEFEVIDENVTLPVFRLTGAEHG